MPKRKYGRPKRRVIDQETISQFLKSIGFKVESIAQEWRHLHAFGKYQNKDAVFKLASTQKTSSKTQNEYHWNEAVHLVPEEKRPNLEVPLNYSSGSYGNLFYFIAERFLGEPLVVRNSQDLSKVTPRIKQIAQMTREVETLLIPEDCKFAIFQKPKDNPTPIGHNLFAACIEWASQIPMDLAKFLKVLEEAKDNLRSCVDHGDFVIRQMWDVKGKIGIIDGEHAGLRGPLYYDVAQFYIRLRNDQNAPELSRDYLLAFKDLLSISDQDTYWEELKPLLIERYIGDLWGAALKKDGKRLNGLTPLGQEILEDKII
ncbi:MAG: hypothetical protein G01um10147_955 [Microgenomates group bacterium Gr01-1014_7]|nr:MAG: hypothetical protein G01um10147_955 [Microgenomates group bacterium Gr01-1014_7]